jgi:hypothetical protein
MTLRQKAQFRGAILDAICKAGGPRCIPIALAYRKRLIKKPKDPFRDIDELLRFIENAIAKKE